MASMPKISIKYDIFLRLGKKLYLSPNSIIASESLLITLILILQPAELIQKSLSISYMT